MSNQPILLKDIWPIEGVTDYKVHFGRYDGRNPLDLWVGNRAVWKVWQEYYPSRNAFNREFIFSLMDFYFERDTWLFGGVFRVKGRRKERYEVELTKYGAPFIGRLKLYSPYRHRQTRVNFENHYDNFHVREVLREPYSGQSFPGYENINLSFDELDGLIRNDRPDWKAALKNVQGIYLITDTKTNKRYVGSAYSDSGIWSRWGQYIQNGHGGNAGLRDLLKKSNGVEYCQKNFKFSLLEYHSMNAPDTIVTDREKFWKKVLLTGDKYGYNKN